MAFQQGLSGLNAASKGLDVIGNNVANASTVGFKTGSAHFGDVYATSLSATGGGGGGSQVGIGTSVLAIQQQFTQGNTTSTNNPLDIAINGGGFFKLISDNGVSYTRNGQFHTDKAGYIVNDLRINIRIAAEHAQTRSLGCAGDLAAHTGMALCALGFLIKFAYHLGTPPIISCRRPCLLCGE